MSPICLLWGVTAGESPLCVCVSVCVCLCISAWWMLSLPSATGGSGGTQTNKRTGATHRSRVCGTHKVRPLGLLKLSVLEAHLFVCLASKQGIGGREAPMKATKPWNNRRFIGTFDVENTTKGDSGRYRCIVHSDKGVGVSNYGELTIKREYGSQSRAATQTAGMLCHPRNLHATRQSHREINRKCRGVCRWKRPLRRY